MAALRKIHLMDLPRATIDKLKEEVLLKMRDKRKAEELPAGQAEQEKNVLDYGTITHTTEEMEVPKDVVRNTKTKVPKKKWPKPDGSVFTYRRISFASLFRVKVLTLLMSMGKMMIPVMVWPMWRPVRSSAIQKSRKVWAKTRNLKRGCL